MDIVFDRGSKESPKGHAFLYFRSSSDREEIWATYITLLPITVDVSKYVPPFLMNQVGELGVKELSAFAFPPAPEKVDSFGRLEELAAIRDDDVIYAGTIDPDDVASGMMSVNTATQWYAEVYGELIANRPGAETEIAEETSGLGVNEILYGLMSDADRLSELTRLVGKLRFAVEGTEEALIREAESDIYLLAKHLPENHSIPRLIEAAKAGGSRGAALADLYLQRCFHLVLEEYVKLGRVEEQIRAHEVEDTPS